jgi:hypothetical protein
MLSRYYSLDECYDTNLIFDKLEDLQNEGMILYETIDQDVIKIKDIGLSEKDTKDLINFFNDNDVIDLPSYENVDELDDEDDDFDDEDYRLNDDYF